MVTTNARIPQALTDTLVHICAQQQPHTSLTSALRADSHTRAHMHSHALLYHDVRHEEGEQLGDGALLPVRKRPAELGHLLEGGNDAEALRATATRTYTMHIVPLDY